MSVSLVLAFRRDQIMHPHEGRWTTLVLDSRAPASYRKEQVDARLGLGRQMLDLLKRRLPGNYVPISSR